MTIKKIKDGGDETLFQESNRGLDRLLKMAAIKERSLSDSSRSSASQLERSGLGELTAGRWGSLDEPGVLFAQIGQLFVVLLLESVPVGHGRLLVRVLQDGHVFAQPALTVDLGP